MASILLIVLLIAALFILAGVFLDCIGASRASGFAIAGLVSVSLTCVAAYCYTSGEIDVCTVRQGDTLEQMRAQGVACRGKLSEGVITSYGSVRREYQTAHALIVLEDDRVLQVIRGG